MRCRIRPNNANIWYCHQFRPATTYMHIRPLTQEALDLLGLDMGMFGQMDRLGIRFAVHVRVADWNDAEPLSFEFFKAETVVIGE
jgi:hypothetical protein